jgi:hypothetical protein
MRAVLAALAFAGSVVVAGCSNPTAPARPGGSGHPAKVITTPAVGTTPGTTNSIGNCFEGDPNCVCKPDARTGVVYCDNGGLGSGS